MERKPRGRPQRNRHRAQDPKPGPRQEDHPVGGQRNSGRGSAGIHSLQLLERATLVRRGWLSRYLSGPHLGAARPRRCRRSDILRGLLLEPPAGPAALPPPARGRARAGRGGSGDTGARPHSRSSREPHLAHWLLAAGVLLRGGHGRRLAGVAPVLQSAGDRLRRPHLQPRRLFLRVGITHTATPPRFLQWPAHRHSDWDHRRLCVRPRHHARGHGARLSLGASRQGPPLTSGGAVARRQGRRLLHAALGTVVLLARRDLRSQLHRCSGAVACAGDLGGGGIDLRRHPAREHPLPGVEAAHGLPRSPGGGVDRRRCCLPGHHPAVPRVPQ